MVTYSKCIALEELKAKLKMHALYIFSESKIQVQRSQHQTCINSGANATLFNGNQKQLGPETFLRALLSKSLVSNLLLYL